MTRKTTASLEADVLIVGGGLSGLTLAGVLGRAGVDVIILDRDPPVTQLSDSYDVRATALSYATSRVLDSAGVWDRILPLSSPIHDIRVADGAAPFFLHFEAEAHGGKEAFGWNVENTALRKTLHDNLTGMKNVRHLAPVEIQKFFRTESRAGAQLKDGRKLSAPLLIGADGRGSSVRKWLGIETKTADYKQSAIACTIAHTKNHGHVAVEHFLPAGPFAVLPLTKSGKGEYRSSVIWSVHGAGAEDLTRLPQKDFDAELQKLCGTHLGRVRCVSQPRAYPLSLMHAEKYTGPRTALIAEAAHVIHPIAGQGLNLGMRDVALLASLVTDSLKLGLDIGASGLLSKYENMRRADTHLMAGFTDLLNRLFSNDFKTVGLVRGLGIEIIDKIPPAKTFFARQAMGLGGTRDKARGHKSHPHSA